MEFSTDSWFSQMGGEQNPIFDDETDFLGVEEESPNNLTPTLLPLALEPQGPHEQFGNPTRNCSAHFILNFENATLQGPEVSRHENCKAKKKKRVRIRRPSQVHHHIMTERKRREQLNQLFITLSGLVPGIKRVDKNSVLRDTIEYFKNLLDRLKILEVQRRNQMPEPMVVVKKSQFTIEGNSILNAESIRSNEQQLPEIEAKLCNNRIILKIYCEKRKGVLVELVGHVEKFNLAIVNTNVVAFGTFTVHITIVAEMEKEFDSTVQGIVEDLRSRMLQC